MATKKKKKRKNEDREPRQVSGEAYEHCAIDAELLRELSRNGAIAWLKE